MKIQRLHKTLVLVAICIICNMNTGTAQEVENDFQSRTEVKLSFKPAKKLKINLTPQLRFNNELQFDQYLLEGEVVYKAIKHVSVGASYRLKGNQNKDSEIEYSNRYLFFTEVEKKIERFTPSLRLCFTNSADEDDDINNQYLRYKTAVDYNIRKCKLTPSIGIEAFHDLTNSNFYKMRYNAGLNYRLFKNNSLGLKYKLDYYLQESRNKHIFTLAYKIKF